MTLTTRIFRNALGMAAGLLLGFTGAATAVDCEEGTLEPLCWWYFDCGGTCVYENCESARCHAGAQPRDCGDCET